MDEDNDGRFPEDSAVQVRYPRDKQQEQGDRLAWPWLPGPILSQCGPDEWYVCVEARELAMLDDGRPAPDGTADGKLLYPCCFRTAARFGVPPTGRSGDPAVADCWFFWLAIIGGLAWVYSLPTVIAIARQVEGLAAVTGITTLLRVNRALTDASVGERGSAASHNAAARAEAARLISAGHAGLISGHTHEPEISQLGHGSYANTGCATEVVRARKARFGLPEPPLVGRFMRPKTPAADPRPKEPVS